MNVEKIDADVGGQVSSSYETWCERKTTTHTSSPSASTAPQHKRTPEKTLGALSCAEQLTAVSGTVVIQARNASVAQLVEHAHGKGEAVSSTLTGSSVAVAQLVERLVVV